MSRLIDRNKQVPNGFTYYQPETGWKPPRYASFETIVQGIISHRQANPWLMEKHGWSIDPEAVREELDAYNAKVCEQMGWTNYITGIGDPSPPLSSRPSQSILQRGRAVAVGAETIVDFVRKDEAVSPDISQHRAETCASCRFNTEGDLLSFFTRPVSEAIRKALELVRGDNLTTTLDSKLGVCSVCDCPLRLKVHFPMPRIQAKMNPETVKQLPEWCWILKEWK